MASEAAAGAGLGPACLNPFRSIVVRAVELVFACDEALALVEAYDPPDPPAEVVPPRRGVGTGATEAPRGLLLHRYEIDEDGTILQARIMPPTSQNQLTIEADLRRVVAGRARPQRRRPPVAVRTGGAQPRPVHLLCRPLPRRLGGEDMIDHVPRVVVAGLGSEYRRDDGVGTRGGGRAPSRRPTSGTTSDR